MGRADGGGELLRPAAPLEGVPGLAFLRKSGRDVACWAGAEALPLSVMHLYTASPPPSLFIHLVRFLVFLFSTVPLFRCLCSLPLPSAGG